MPFSPSMSACTLSSVNLELPPSTTTSPGLSSSPSSLTVARVGSPAGTMTQTTRGAVSASTSAGSESTSRLSAWWSKPTTSWPARRTRSAMLPPILPSPISPSCTMSSPLGASRIRCPSCPVRRVAAGSAGQPHGHDQVAVAAGPFGRLALVVIGGRLVDPGQDGGLERAGEVHPPPFGVPRGQAVEQERRVEPDRQRLAVELDVAALLGLALVVGAAGPQGHLTGRELAAQRCAALGDQRHALGGVGEQADRQDGVGGRLVRHDRAVLHELGVEQAGRRLPVLAREAEDALA